MARVTRQLISEMFKYFKPNKQPLLVEKTWGDELWIINDKKRNLCAKILTVWADHECSLHHHVNKWEVFYLLSGAVNIKIYNKDGTHYHNCLRPDNPGPVEIPQGTPHKIIGVDLEGESKLLEVSTFHEDSDSYRIKQ